MDRTAIKEMLFGAIKKFQALSGDEIPALSEDTVPIGECEGFDSQRAVEVLVDLESQLGINLPGDANLFVSEDGTKALSIKTIAERIFKLLSKS